MFKEFLVMLSQDIHIGELIKNFRLASGISQMELELKISASPGSVSRIENGKVNPKKETLIAIAKALSLDSIKTASLFGIKI